MSSKAARQRPRDRAVNSSTGPERARIVFGTTSLYYGACLVGNFQCLISRFRSCVMVECARTVKLGSGQGGLAGTARAPRPSRLRSGLRLGAPRLQVSRGGLRMARPSQRAGATFNQRQWDRTLERDDGTVDSLRVSGGAHACPPRVARRLLWKAPGFDWEAPVVDWEAPALDWEAPVVDWGVPAFYSETPVCVQSYSYIVVIVVCHISILVSIAVKYNGAPASWGRVS